MKKEKRVAASSAVKIANR